MSLSVIGIILALITLITLALRGWHIIIIAPLAAIIVALTSNMNVIESLYGEYMTGFIGYAQKFYLLFLTASIFAKFMDDSGAAKSIALGILRKLGKEKPFYILLAVWIITSVLTYGGINLFVVAFALIPIALPLFKEMNLPWHLALAPFFLGMGTATMTMLPGTPAAQNIMPTKYLGTTATAAPLIGVVSAILASAIGLYYVYWAMKKAQARGEVFEQPASLHIGKANDDSKLPPFVLAIIPPIALLALLNIVKVDIVYACLGGTLLCIILFWKYLDNILDTLNKGALNTVVPIINTCADVGFGRVVAAAAGFAILSDALMSIPGHPLVSMSVGVNLMSAITGSASGGLGIALDVLVPKYVAMGLNPEVIHRIAAMSSGGLDAMPHNGAVITVLAVFGLNHKLGYRHCFATVVATPLIVLIPAIIMGILFY